MPELPEVETIRRGLEPAILGSRFENIQINRYDLRGGVPKDFTSVVQGQKVESTQRRGKYILIFLEHGDVIVLHMGMSGRVRIYEAGAEVSFEKHDHAIFIMTSGTQIVFNDPRRFGMLYLMKQQDWQSQKPFAAMGPEPLDNNFTGPVFYERLAHRKVSIKAALLDQRVVVGVGNIYACEALFQAKIHPERAAGSLSLAETTALAESVKDVLNRAISAGGSSLKDYAHTDGKLGYFQTCFSVYDHEGDACPGCTCVKADTGGVQRITQAGRSTFYCPVKQA